MDRPGDYIGDRLAAQRVGVYGLDYAMTVRDFEGTHLRVELVPFDLEFDLARAVKSSEEIESVRDSVRINTEGFWAFLEAYRPGKSAAEVLAPAERLFVEEGCGRLTMNMVLIGPEFAMARRHMILGDFCIPSLEVAGPGGHWVEVSRALGEPNAEVSRMLEAYEEYFEVAKLRSVPAHGSRRSPRGLEGLHRPWLPPRACDGPLDRHDDDRASEDR